MQNGPVRAGSSVHRIDAERGDVAVEAARSHNLYANVSPGTAIVRIEVCDTGAGLRSRDLEGCVCKKVMLL